MIRKGQEFSYVEASIYLEENEENIVVSREIFLNGRNTCKINGRLTSVNELKNFMKDIIDIHGQHENQTLLDESTHIKFLDNFANMEIEEVKQKYLDTYKKYNYLREEISKNFGDDKEKQRELDLLKYQNKEIEDVGLKLTEEEELEVTRQKMLNSEKISTNLEEANIQIGNVAIDAISTSIRALEKIEGIDSKYEASLNSLRSVYYDVQELSRDIADFSENIFFDEEERERTEKRLDVIYKLKRKYGNSIEEILKYNEEVRERIKKIESLDEYVNSLKNELNGVIKELEDIGGNMHKIRKCYAKILEEKINSELKDLEMKNAKFSVKLEYNENNEFGPNGLDKVEFMICTNIGEDDKPLSKIASGGELSRIMLGIKNVLADSDKVSTMVFDEIDTGISGMAANSVSEKLKSISGKHQVLCVTHLANIAAKGDYNYYICKEVEDDRTLTSVKRLSEEETIYEIARIASGDTDEIAIKHAKSLRKIA